MTNMAMDLSWTRQCQAALWEFCWAWRCAYNPLEAKAGMDVNNLRREYGQYDVTLPTGQPVQFPAWYRPTRALIFNTVHNIRPDVPAENIIAMYEALDEYRR